MKDADLRIDVTKVIAISHIKAIGEMSNGKRYLNIDYWTSQHEKGILAIYGEVNAQKTSDQLTYILGKQGRGPALFIQTEKSNIVDAPITNAWLESQGYQKQLRLSDKFEPPKSNNNFLRHVEYSSNSKFYYEGRKVGKPSTWAVVDVEEDFDDDMAFLTSPVKSTFK